MDFEYPSSASHEDLRLLEPTAITRNSLHFTLIKVPRIATPVYTAVSYTWGDDEPSEFIYLNNRKVYVRPNLWSCLYYLGQHASRQGIKLWVDAICIDQSNSAERSSQVRRMDETYRRAAHVSVWLGLPKIPDHILIPDNLRPIKTIEVDPFDWCDNLEDLANRSYWSRVWVIQEFLLGQNVVLYCGNTRMLWSDFQTMLCHEAEISEHTYDASFGTPGHPANDAAASFRALPLVMGRHVDKHPELLQSLHDLLVSHHRAECKDPRDKVFGLLGLVTLEEREMLERFFPDYTMSEDHVRVIALAHVMQYNVLMGAPEVNSRSDELFSGLGVKSATERRRYLQRASMEGFDYANDWGIGEASRALTLLDDERQWTFYDEDEDDELTRLAPQSERRLGSVVGYILVAAIVILAGWRYGVLGLRPA